MCQWTLEIDLLRIARTPRADRQIVANGKREVLVDGLVFPEGPRWRAGRLWFSDMLAGRVMAADLEGRATTLAEHDEWLSGLGWLPDGRLLVVAMQSRRLLRLEGEELVTAADLASLTSFLTNDMVVDDQGRAYIGEVGFDVHGGAPFKAAALVLVTSEGEARIVDPDLACPNGMVITPDRRTLIVAESLADRLTAYDIIENGSLGNRRTWAAVEGLGPDGICLDAEGCVWVASPMQGRVQRVREGGEVLESFTTPIMPLATMLGGPERDTLFICEAPRPDEALGARQGRIECMQVAAPGVGLP